jgi:hypothetical protein
MSLVVDVPAIPLAFGPVLGFLLLDRVAVTLAEPRLDRGERIFTAVSIS